MKAKKGRCRVPKNWIRDEVGFEQTGKYSWAVHFGKTGGAQFIYLQQGGAPNSMSGVVSRKKHITTALCHRVEDPFANREGIWKPGSELSIHSGSMSGVRLNRHTCGTTDARITHHQNCLSSLCLSRLLWVCWHLSCWSSAQSCLLFQALSFLLLTKIPLEDLL